MGAKTHGGKRPRGSASDALFPLLEFIRVLASITDSQWKAFTGWSTRTTEKPAQNKSKDKSKDRPKAEYDFGIRELRTSTQKLFWSSPSRDYGKINQILHDPLALRKVGRWAAGIICGNQEFEPSAVAIIREHAKTGDVFTLNEKTTRPEELNGYIDLEGKDSSEKKAEMKSSWYTEVSYAVVVALDPKPYGSDTRAWPDWLCRAIAAFYCPDAMHHLINIAAKIAETQAARSRFEGFAKVYSALYAQKPSG
jgi:hypothetical protein